MTSARDRLTLVIVKDDGSRVKHPLRSWVGVPRKNELFWIGEDPFLVMEVEYAVVEGFFGGMSVEAAGVYVRPLSEQEQSAVARRLSGQKPEAAKTEFRP